MTTLQDLEGIQARYDAAKKESIDASESYAQATLDFLRAIAAALAAAEDLAAAKAIGVVVAEAVAHCECPPIP